MRNLLRERLVGCIEDLRRGKLTEQQLNEVLELSESGGIPRQDLLYLQAKSTALESQVQGMLLVKNGELSDGPANPDDWPYPTVLAAIRDGWRVIQFPNLSLLMNEEQRTYGLGAEFILERMERIQ